MSPAFFEPTDGGLVPHADARGPWAADMMHGRLLAGLLGWAVEECVADPAFRPARLTVDLFRSPRMEPVNLDAVLVREGGRVKAADASARIGGVEVARASSVFLRAGDEPDTDAARTAPWDATLPGGVDPVQSAMPFEVRPVDGEWFGSPWPRRVWLRDTRELVAGVALTPFVRAALAADLTSPLANSTSTGLDHINADVDLHLGRQPNGEWIGFETTERISSEGISVVVCRLHDVAGPIGTSTACAIINARMTPPG